MQKKIKFKYFTAADYNEFTNEINDNKVKVKELVKRCDIFKFINNSDLDKK